MLSLIGIAVLVLSLLSAAVWVYVNYAGGRGRSLDYRLDPDAPERPPNVADGQACLLYTSDAADE